MFSLLSDGGGEQEIGLTGLISLSHHFAVHVDFTLTAAA